MHHPRTRSEYKSFVHSVYIQNPITVHPVCQNVSLLLFDAITDIVEMSYAYKDEIWVQIICSFCLSKTQFLPVLFVNYVRITVWWQHWHSGDVICMLGQDLSTNHSGDVICIQGRDPSTNHLWLCLSKTQFLSALLPKCVMITVWCHHRHSGDVICIQGRDLSTNHLWYFSSKTLFPKLCHDYCLMPSPT
jgi:hypothetical protein